MNKIISPSKTLAAALLLTLSLGGCENPSSTVKYVAISSAIGAGTGAAAVAVTSGCVPCGAALGAAVGAGVGFCFDMLENKR